MFLEGNYLKAIDFFEKSLERKESAKTYYQLGNSYFHLRKLEEAEDSLHKGLKLEDHPDSFNLLGWILFLQEKYENAITHFRRSIEIQKDSSSYIGLQYSFFNLKKFHDSILAAEESLKLNYDKDSYMQLLKTYGEILSRSISLGNSREVNETISKGISFENDILPFHKGRYLEFLAEFYEFQGLTEQAIRSQYLSYLDSCQTPVAKIDPFLGLGKDYQELNSQKIEELKVFYQSNDFEFSPSFKMNKDNIFLDSWKYLVHLHIPKCGGTSIRNPLKYLFDHFLELEYKNSNDSNKFDFLNLNIPTVQYKIKAFDQFLKNKKNFNGIFYSAHGDSWREFYQNINNKFNISQKIITLIRNPRDRLYSMIKMGAHDCNSISELYEKINKEPFLYDNCMYKYLYYGRLNIVDNLAPKIYSEAKHETLDDIYFVDINDRPTIKNIRSAFLTSTNLPNILQYSRFKDSNDRDKIFIPKISKQEINQAYQKCLDEGFVEKDESIDFDFLKKRTLDNLLPLDFDQANTSFIHPLTFIIYKDNQYLIIPTIKLLKDPSIVFKNKEIIK